MELSEDIMHKVVNGEKVNLTQAEIEEKELEELANQQKSIIKQQEFYNKNLKSICRSYQHNEGECDENFFALLTASKGVAKALNVPLGPKAQACLDWCDALWLDYYSRKGDYTKGIDFSGHGVVPYSFAEVRAETEAL